MSQRSSLAFLLAASLSLTMVAQTPSAPKALLELSPILRQSPLLLPVLKRADPESLVLQTSRKQAPQRVLDRSAMRDLQIEPSPGQRMALNVVFDQVTAGHRRLSADLGRIPPTALAGSAETTEAVVEFLDRVVLVRNFRVVVRDAQQAAQTSPEFAAMLAPVDRARLASVRITDLKAEQQAGFRIFLAGEFTDLPADDPLKQALARGGEDEVLRTMLAGEGELEVTDEIELMRAPIADWKAFLPAGFREPLAAQKGSTPAGSAPLKAGAKKGPSAQSQVPGGLGSQPQQAATFDPATHEYRYAAGERASGEQAFEAPFLAGYSTGYWNSWSRRWKFGHLGWLRLSLGYGVGLGLRIPMVLEGRLSPTLVERSAPDCPEHDVRLQLQARPFDAPAAFYQERGLPANQVFDGQEFVLQAGTSLSFKLVAFGETVKQGTLNGPSVNRSADFTPPLKERRDLCTVWIPPELTQTVIEYGVLSAFVKVGVGLQGRGEVMANCFPWIDGRRGTAFPAKLSSAPFRGGFKLPALPPGAPGSLKGQPFGLEVKLQGYRLDLSAVLKLTAGAKIDVDYFDRTVQLPALDLLTIDLAGLELGPHAGTEDTYRWNEGLLAFENRPGSLLKPKAGGPILPPPVKKM
jgi:hypothetical protein